MLVLIVCLALLLTYRRYRLRRRYWTATQLAISRGEPVPHRWHEDDPWGLLFPRPERWHGRKKERRWMRIPTLWDAAEESPARAGETEAENIWEGKGQVSNLGRRGVFRGRVLCVPCTQRRGRWHAPVPGPAVRPRTVVGGPLPASRRSSFS